MQPLSERDWKYLSRLKEPLLERYCSQILDRLHAETLPSNRNGGAYNRYSAINKALQEHNRTIDECFSDWRRSTIHLRLLSLIHHKILLPEEIARLSQETRKRIENV